MRTRRILRALLLLLLLGAVPMEALFLLRPSLVLQVHEAYPQVGVNRDGEVRYYDVDVSDQQTYVLHCLDAERRAIGSIPPPWDLAIGAWGWPSGMVPSLEPRFLRQGTTQPRTSILRAIAKDLSMREAERRDLPQPVPLFWRTEGGRVICRDTATGRVLAGIGPDGYARGEAAAQGEPFANPGPSVALGRHTADGWHGAGLAILDDGRRIVALLVPATPAAAVPKDSVEPLEIVVETRPVSDGMVDWTESPWVARTGDEIQILLTTGARIGRVRLDEGESIISTAGDREMSGKRLVARPPPQSVGIATALMPGHPATKRIRLRLFRPLMPMAQHDVLLEPMRPSESIPANFAAALALLRPLPLNVAASLSPLPKDPAESFRWWWRDPWLADGSYAGWLFASAALAALLALRARRVARERCATAREVRLWTAAVFLLGPVGLLWMRLVLPRVPVERVGAARRAVNLDASPSASAPWPEPARDGIEVFG